MRWWRKLSGINRFLVVSWTLLGLVIVGFAVANRPEEKPGPPRVAIGTKAWGSVPDGRAEHFTSSVETVTGQVDVSASVGASAELAMQSKLVRAPRDGRLVEIFWSSAPRVARETQDVPLPSAFRPRAEKVRLALRVGRRDFDIVDGVQPTASSESARSLVIAVPAQGDLTVVATSLGRTQTVNLKDDRRAAGEFAGFYGHQSNEDHGGNAAQGAMNGRQFWAHSEIEVVSTPYVEGLGWAKHGRAWAVLVRGSLEVEPVATDRGLDGLKESTKVHTAVTADGHGAVRRPTRLTVTTGFEPTLVIENAVFDVSATRNATLSFSLSAPLQPMSREGTAVPGGHAVNYAATRTNVLYPIVDTH